MGLFASSKLLSGKMQLLGLVPGLMMGIAAYLKTRKIEQELDEYDDTDSDYEIEEIDENGKNQFWLSGQWYNFIKWEKFLVKKPSL